MAGSSSSKHKAHKAGWRARIPGASGKQWILTKLTESWLPSFPLALARSWHVAVGPGDGTGEQWRKKAWDTVTTPWEKWGLMVRVASYRRGY